MPIMTPTQTILDHAARCDRFRPEELHAELPGVNIAAECQQLVKAGLLVALWPDRYATANQLTDGDIIQAARRADLHKLDAECSATRRTLSL